MKSNKTSSRREVLRTVVLSALLSTIPLLVVEAATKGDPTSVIALADGSRLIIQKIGGVGRGAPHYVATRQVGDKIIDENPTGSFMGKNGQVILWTREKSCNLYGWNKLAERDARRRLAGRTGSA